jgi:hypothetical protein
MSFSKKTAHVYTPLDDVGSLAYMCRSFFLVKWETAPAALAHQLVVATHVFIWPKKLLPRSFEPETCTLLQISVTTKLLACSYK